MSDRISSASLFVASLLYVVYQVLFVILPIVSHSHSSALHNHLAFASVFVCSFFSVQLFIIQLLSVIFCSATENGISIPITTTILQFNKHHTTRLRHLLS
jgi:hypothetical protein